MIGAPIKRLAEVTGEPIRERAKMGALHCTGREGGRPLWWLHHVGCSTDK